MDQQDIAMIQCLVIYSMKDAWIMKITGGMDIAVLQA